jgi:hypothetical protein
VENSDRKIEMKKLNQAYSMHDVQYAAVVLQKELFEITEVSIVWLQKLGSHGVTLLP